MTDLVLATPEGVDLRFELAGPGTRILAAAIDGLLFTLAFLATALFLELGGISFATRLLASGAVLLLVGYSFVFSLILEGRTPGKLWIGIRVADARGFAPRASQLFLRALFVPLEALLILPVPLVWILVAATPLRQRLGDLVAGTIVLRERAPRAPPEPVPNQSWSGLETRAFALDPAVARGFDGRDLALLRDLLTRRELDPMARPRLYLRAARHYAARFGLDPGGLDPSAARTLLREVFLLVREVREVRPGAAPLTIRRAGAAGDRAGTPASGSPPR